MSNVIFRPNTPLEPHDIADLREAVGWERHAEDYPIALKHYWATMSGIDAEGMLIAWCTILSDSVRHAILLDVIVHPKWQRQGIGLALVEAAVSYIRIHGISIIHVDFEPEHATFYERCGFRTGLGGIFGG